jgi:hypothetical protein
MLCISKGVYKIALHNPNNRVAPNYSIVEDLSQTLCVMSSLEVLQSFPMQHVALLYVIREMDSSIHLTMNFDATDVKPNLPYHVSLPIDVVYTKNVIRRTIIDEGASTCVMSLSCWKAIDSLEIAPSRTLLIAFEKLFFRPHRIISSFPIHLGGNSMSIEVEVVDMTLDYNFLLGRSWTCAIMVVVSLVF